MHVLFMPILVILGRQCHFDSTLVVVYSSAIIHFTFPSRPTNPNPCPLSIYLSIYLSTYLIISREEDSQASRQAGKQASRQADRQIS